MSITSFTHYTSVGLDDELLRDGTVMRRYWRLRWPGNGAVFVGYGQHVQPDLTQPSERFDLAARFFSSDNEAVPIWEGRLIGGRAVQLGDTDAARQSWIGIPSFYPPLVLFVIWWRMRKR